MDSLLSRRCTRSRSVCGESLRKFRLLEGMTQADLASRSGYTTRLIRKAEAGGKLSLSTIEDIAEALSVRKLISVEDLCVSPLAIAKKFVESYDRHGQAMLESCGHLLAESFEFNCAGDADSPMFGCWRGRSGFQCWLEYLFSMVSRPEQGKLAVTYLESQDRVSAHYADTFLAVDGTRHEMWVNLHFFICEGRIQRIDNEYDTQLACKLEGKLGMSHRG